MEEGVQEWSEEAMVRAMVRNQPAVFDMRGTGCFDAIAECWCSEVDAVEASFRDGLLRVSADKVLRDLRQGEESDGTANGRDVIVVPVAEHEQDQKAGEESASGYGERPVRNMPLATALEQDGRGRYIIDWHLGADLQRRLYHIPRLLAEEDWLNWWWDVAVADRRSDYRFVYMGDAAVSWTPVHHDVMCSYSWSVNIAGCKSWWLIPPEDTPLLATTSPEGGSSSAGVVSDVRDGRYDTQRFPRVLEARVRRVEQREGQLLFVPSGWHHMVVNHSTVSPLVLSVNHNWFNACSLPTVWQFLLSEHRAVVHELSDLRDTFESLEAWARQVEVVLRANSAMSLSDFLDLLQRRTRYLGVKGADDPTVVAWADMPEALRTRMQAQLVECCEGAGELVDAHEEALPLRVFNALQILHVVSCMRAAEVEPYLFALALADTAEHALEDSGDNEAWARVDRDMDRAEPLDTGSLFAGLEEDLRACVCRLYDAAHDTHV